MKISPLLRLLGSKDRQRILGNSAIVSAFCRVPCALTAIAIFLGVHITSASATTVTFESLAAADADVHNHGISYVESGFQFTTNGDNLATWGTMHEDYPGSTALFLNGNTGGITTLTQVGGGAFSISSISLAQAYRSSIGLSVTFTGLLADSTTVEQTFILSASGAGPLSLTTFAFTNPGFNNVISVMFAQHAGAGGPFYQFDNVVLGAPTQATVSDASDSVMLMLIGLAAIYTFGFKLPSQASVRSGYCR